MKFWLGLWRLGLFSKRGERGQTGVGCHECYEMMNIAR